MSETADHEILKLLAERDSYAAIAALSSGEPAAVLKRFDQVSTDLYWKHKKLQACVTIARAGVQYALMHAASELRDHAKTLTYNIASYTWPGWDEPGIVITPDLQAAGLDAAKANLRLCQEENLGPLAISRAYWMLAGHALAAGHREAARSFYIEAAENADEAEREAERLLATAFVLLVDQLDGQDVAADLDAAKAALAGEKHGADFVQQIETAQRVFAR